MPDTEWKNATADNTDMWDKESGKTLTGIYTKKKTDIGKNKSNVYLFRQTDGTTLGMWGSAIVDNAMDNIQIGEEVQVKYLGKKEGKSGQEYHDYEILFRPAAFRPATDTPQNTPQAPTSTVVTANNDEPPARDEDVPQDMPEV